MTLPILTADDYGMTDGVSRSIEALAFMRRLSATSVMSTMPEWPAAALRLRHFRDRLSIGLHLNLTLGAPSVAMPHLTTAGAMPSLANLLRMSLLGRLDASEITDEIRHQLDAFERHLGFPPDHIDGHQHVQVLPVVRSALLDELVKRYPTARPLVRDPSDAADHLWSRGLAGAKVLTVRALSAGFARAARAHSVPVNDRFAGYSSFDTAISYRNEITSELDRTARDRRGIAVIMCHPAYPDAALAALDPVVERRQQEHDTLMQLEDLPDRIWHAARAPDGAMIDWHVVSAANGAGSRT